MKTWYVEYEHLVESNIRGYTVIAEDDDLAAEVGKESLENDEKNWDANPRNWKVISVSQVEVCTGCGAYRRMSAPQGEGSIPI